MTTAPQKLWWEVDGMDPWSLWDSFQPPSPSASFPLLPRVLLATVVSQVKMV